MLHLCFELYQALVRCAEDVIHTLAEALPLGDAQTREDWVLDLDRLKEHFHSAIEFPYQTLRAVSDFYNYYNKVGIVLTSRPFHCKWWVIREMVYFAVSSKSGLSFNFSLSLLYSPKAGTTLSSVRTCSKTSCGEYAVRAPPNSASLRLYTVVSLRGGSRSVTS